MSAAWKFARASAAASAPSQLVRIGGTPELCLCLSTAPIIAERAMYFGASPLWKGGHESAGVTAPSRSWFLAEGATGETFVKASKELSDLEPVVARIDELRSAERAQADAETLLDDALIDAELLQRLLGIHPEDQAGAETHPANGQDLHDDSLVDSTIVFTDGASTG